VRFTRENSEISRLTSSPSPALDAPDIDGFDEIAPRPVDGNRPAPADEKECGEQSSNSHNHPLTG
jgi:hypothetical protein